jgi:hypothetical protein
MDRKGVPAPGKTGAVTAENRQAIIGSRAWWFKNIAIGVLSVVFLLFGIDSMAAAYRKNNVFEFIMYFFSSSMIILVSIVGIIYPAFQIRAYFKPRDTQKDHEDN